MESPIACKLADAEMRERRRTILDLVRQAASDVIPLPLGVVYRFQSTPQILTQLDQLVELERQCCPFLTFRAIVESDDQSVYLEVTGPLEARAVIVEIFGP